MSKLKVFHASAGAGKTYKLTESFLLLLFSNPYQYKSILAVTFTNKATAEMKSRIIAELYKLAHGEDSSYLQTIKTVFQYNNTRISDIAKTALLNILHDFSHFSVETIDGFFQQVIHAFTREIGLQHGFQLELDNDKILSAVVDELLMDINDQPFLKDWLLRLAEEKMESGKSWNIKGDLKSTGKEIFREKFHLMNEQTLYEISDKNLLHQYIQSIQLVKKKFENKLIELGKTGLKIIHENGLTVDDFSNKSRGIAGLFQKLANAEKPEDFVITDGRRNALHDPEKWYTRNSTNKDLIFNIFHASLNPLLTEIIDFFDKNVPDYITSVEILKNIRVLGAFADISKKLKEYTRNENIFLLSDAGKLLKEIINDNEAPFIYEKTGHYYHHFMIDEFQDTSYLQWNNFKPLVSNSLAENHQSLVVGDIKQSIYRWRNSDWSIMAKDIYDDFQQQGIENHFLAHNWRSHEKIIAFNNVFFSHAARMLNDNFSYLTDNIDLPSFTELYKDVMQQPAPLDGKDGGFVRFEAIPESKETDWKESVLEKLPSLIESWQDQGFLLKDIAIIVRKNAEGKEIADYLLHYKLKQGKAGYRYDLISEESLYISGSKAVRFIIALMKYFVNPLDDINAAYIRYEHQQYIKNGETQVSHELFEEAAEKIQSDIGLPLSHLSLYELTENIIQSHGLNKNQGELIFLNAFQDLVLDYSRTGNPDIEKFLEWWEEEGHSKTVPVNENQDAIRIITIHKAKGLEFENVIIPFCDWRFDNSKQPVTWFYPEKAPFDQISILPLKYVAALENSIFHDQYHEEKYRNYIDNLNLLYVAFTRAKIQLYGFYPLKDKEKNAELTGVNQLMDATFSGSIFELIPDFQKNLTVVSLGQPMNKKWENVDSGQLNYPAPQKYADFREKINIKYNSLNYFEFTDDTRLEKINYGSLMHEIFAQISSPSDIKKAISGKVNGGKISEQQGAYLESEVLELLQQKEVKPWFNTQWQVKNESTLLLPDGKQLRPDRVLTQEEKAIVIEYKFGEKPEPLHQKQVNQYMAYLKQTGYKQVKGYIWYIALRKVMKIE